MQIISISLVLTRILVLQTLNFQCTTQSVTATAWGRIPTFQSWGRFPWVILVKVKNLSWLSHSPRVSFITVWFSATSQSSGTVRNHKITHIIQIDLSACLLFNLKNTQCFIVKYIKTHTVSKPILRTPRILSNLIMREILEIVLLGNVIPNMLLLPLNCNLCCISVTAYNMNKKCHGVKNSIKRQK